MFRTRFAAAVCAIFAMVPVPILAGCGGGGPSTSSTSSAIATAEPSHPASVRAVLTAWKDKGGYDAMKKVVADLNVLSNPVNLDIMTLSRIRGDIGEASSRLLPESVDSHGYYRQFLDHLGASVDAVASHDKLTQDIESGNALIAMQNLFLELRSEGLDG